MCRQIVSYSVLWVANYQTLRTTGLDDTFFREELMSDVSCGVDTETNADDQIGARDRFNGQT